MKATDRELEPVVAAVLAVNRFPLEKAWGLLPKLREAGLTVPAQVADEDLGVLIDRLVAAGYDRGNLTWLLAERLKNLMQAARKGALDGLAAAVARDDQDGAKAILQTVSGIGPKVAESAWMLLK